jgi:hypothetical protein
MLPVTPPTDQRAGVRPISFVLDNGGLIGKPVTLQVRPEDLTRTESQRVSVNQTMGRDTVGWADHWGEALPTCTIAGHTGWRTASGSGMDGAQAFHALNKLVSHDYPGARQAAIDTGLDPMAVKLLFIDLLDDFVWSVTPTTFNLRRNKSRPLLFQYNIVMQAISTDAENPLVVVPQTGTVAGGANALTGAIGKITAIAANIKGMIARASAYINGLIGTVASAIHGFVNAAKAVFGAVMGVVNSVQSLATSAAAGLIGIARDIASVGVAAFQTLSAIKSLPSFIKAEFQQVASAFNEVKCILKNALRPRDFYEDYDGLYGASNCSSTTGGRGASPLAGTNPFMLLQPAPGMSITSAALGSVQSLGRMDPVLAPKSVVEIGRELSTINSGLSVAGLSA